MKTDRVVKVDSGSERTGKCGFGLQGILFPHHIIRSGGESRAGNFTGVVHPAKPDIELKQLPERFGVRMYIGLAGQKLDGVNLFSAPGVPHAHRAIKAAADHASPTRAPVEGLQLGLAETVIDMRHLSPDDGVKDAQHSILTDGGEARRPSADSRRPSKHAAGMPGESAQEAAITGIENPNHAILGGEGHGSSIRTPAKIENAMRRFRG